MDHLKLNRAPLMRHFILSLDTGSIVNCMLADNFALDLHGHLHKAFRVVERYQWIIYNRTLSFTEELTLRFFANYHALACVLV